MIKGKVKTIEPEIIIRTVKNCPKNYDDTPRVLLVDSDSILYTSTYFPEDSIMFFPTEEEQIEEAKFRVRNKLQEIQNNVEEHFNIIHCMLFIGGRNNFRYKIYPEYKANRKEAIKSPILPIIQEYMLEIGAIPAHGGEADDYIFDAWSNSKNNSIVCSIDKDLKSSCHGIFYDYRSYKDVLGEFYLVTEEEAKYNLCTQLIVGDSSDGVNLCPKKGQKHAESVLKIGMTNYQYKKALLKTYIDAWKGDTKLAKEKLRLCYKLLKLHTQEEIKQLMQ